MARMKSALELFTRGGEDRGHMARMFFSKVLEVVGISVTAAAVITLLIAKLWLTGATLNVWLDIPAMLAIAGGTWVWLRSNKLAIPDRQKVLVALRATRARVSSCRSLAEALDLLREAQSWAQAHSRNFWYPLAPLAVMLVTRLGAGSVAWTIWLDFNVARFLTFLGASETSLPFGILDGQVPSAILAGYGPAYHASFGFTTFLVSTIFPSVAVAVGAGLTLYLRKAGALAGENKFRRGAKVITAEELTAAVDANKWGRSGYTVAGVPIPSGIPMRNLAFIGNQGVGKSVAMKNLAAQVFAKKKKCIFWDPVGEFAEMGYREGTNDVILCPMDVRSPGWDIFSEVKYKTDYEFLGHALSPDAPGSDANAKFFSNAGATLLYCVIQKMHSDPTKTTRDMARFLRTATNAELAEYVKGTDAAAFITPAAADQAAGVMATMVGAIKALEHVEDGKFSIRKWVQQDDDSRLFIVSNELIHDTLKPLAQMFLNIAVAAAMDHEDCFYDRIWIFADEFSALGVGPWENSLVRGRKKGLAQVLGIQNISQVQTVFPEKLAETLISNLSTKLLLRVEDAASKETFSQLIGKQELDETSEGKSFSAEARDGASVNTGIQERPAVMPAEIGMLADQEGFLKIAGKYDVARVTYEREEFPAIAARYIPRPDLLVPPRGSVSLAPAAPAETDTPWDPRIEAGITQAEEAAASSTQDKPAPFRYDPRA